MEWISYGSYAAIPSFYIKQGIVTNKKLITITSICDISLLYEAQNIALNYKTGPLSFAIYIDNNYLDINITAIYGIIDSYFVNISCLYDIKIGIVAINMSSSFYIDIENERGFDTDTPLMFKIPTNILRNLAEYQVDTDWIFSIDIDFWYLSDTMNDRENIELLIDGMNIMISSQSLSSGRGIKTVFIVPAFEILTSVATKFEYSSLTKRQLTDLIYLEEIGAFHEGMSAQKCSQYAVWYEASKPYLLDFNKFDCYWSYEPWYIIHKNVSILPQYQWDNSYVGRGLNKVERVYKFRYYCFKFVIMHNLFMIHAPNSMVIHHEDVSNEEKEKWHLFNLQLFINQTRELRERRNNFTQCGGLRSYPSKKKGKSKEDRMIRIDEEIRKRRERRRENRKKRNGRNKEKSLWDTFNINNINNINENDIECENGILSEKNHDASFCRVCCQSKCKKCGGHGCGRIDGMCCIRNIINNKKYCNTSIAPCIMTGNEYCPQQIPIDYLSIF